MRYKQPSQVVSRLCSFLAMHYFPRCFPFREPISLSRAQSLRYERRPTVEELLNRIQASMVALSSQSEACVP